MLLFCERGSMKKSEWKERIVLACKDAGTYQPFFDSVIDTLSQIMETRDNAHSQYVKEGSQPTIIHINKAKEKNVVKNPMLVMENELNAQALSYWRDLGLTPSGLKKLNADGVVKTNDVSLEQLLSNLTDG